MDIFGMTDRSLPIDLWFDRAHAGNVLCMCLPLS